MHNYTIVSGKTITGKLLATDEKRRPRTKKILPVSARIGSRGQKVLIYIKGGVNNIQVSRCLIILY